MLDISTIFNYVKSNITSSDGRFKIIDDEHILDTKTGVELRMYDDTFKITHGDTTVITPADMTQGEQSIIWSIKQMITSPEKAQQRRIERPELTKKRRIMLSDLFENPAPTGQPQPEPDATPYVG